MYLSITSRYLGPVFQCSCIPISSSKYKKDTFSFDVVMHFPFQLCSITRSCPSGAFFRYSHLWLSYGFRIGSDRSCRFASLRKACRRAPCTRPTSATSRLSAQWSCSRCSKVGTGPACIVGSSRRTRRTPGSEAGPLNCACLYAGMHAGVQACAIERTGLTSRCSPRATRTPDYTRRTSPDFRASAAAPLRR